MHDLDCHIQCRNSIRNNHCLVVVTSIYDSDIPTTISLLTSIIIALKSQNSCSPRACAHQILVTFYPWPREISWNWVREGEDRQVKDSLMDDPSLQSNTWMEPFYSSKSPANAKLVGRAVHLALFGRRWRSLSARWKKISSCVPCPKYILRWYSSSSIFLTGNIPLCTDGVGVRGFSWPAWKGLFLVQFFSQVTYHYVQMR